MKEYKYKINGNVYKVAVGDIENNIAQVEVNGTTYKVELENEAPKAIVPKVSTRPASAPRTETGAPVVAKVASSSGVAAVKSPLPGVINDILVKVGDDVKVGQTILILEAMKMENDIVAPEDGTIASINVANGDAVESGAVLATLN